MKKEVEIRCESGNVVVRNGKEVIFSKKKTEQAVAVANCIYFAEKYKNCNITREEE